MSTEQRQRPAIEVYRREKPRGPDCPVQGCDEFWSYSVHELHDHLSDAHPTLWETIMSGEVVINE